LRSKNDAPEVNLGQSVRYLLLEVPTSRLKQGKGVKMRQKTCQSCGWAIKKDELLNLWLNEFGNERCGTSQHAPAFDRSKLVSVT